MIRLAITPDIVMFMSIPLVHRFIIRHMGDSRKILPALSNDSFNTRLNGLMDSLEEDLLLIDRMIDRAHDKAIGFTDFVVRDEVLKVPCRIAVSTT